MCIKCRASPYKWDPDKLPGIAEGVSQVNIIPLSRAQQWQASALSVEQ